MRNSIARRAIPVRMGVLKTRCNRGLTARVWCFAQMVLCCGAFGAGFAFKPVSTNSLGLWEGGQPVFVYNHGIISKSGVPTDRSRSAYLHPMYGLDGEVLTDDFPKDHYHHRGLFWAWPHVKVGGKEHDLWMLKGVRHQFERVARQEAGSNAVLSVENAWMEGNRRILKEVATFTVHPAAQNSRAIDVELVLTPVDRDISLTGAEDKSYGGLTLRFAPRTNTVITTSLGNGTNDLPMTRLPWADLTAEYPGVSQASGAAVFIHPEHPGYPPMWLTRHYGVLCVGWPGVDAKVLKPGEAVTLGYRVLIHRGRLSGAQLQTLYSSYKGGLGSRSAY